MAVETVNTIADLDPLQPSGAAPKSEGDDHIRNVKKALKTSFAGFDGAVVVTGPVEGTRNAYAVVPATAVPAYAARMLVVFAPTQTNDGPVTLEVSGLGPRGLYTVDGRDAAAGELLAGHTLVAIYGNGVFNLVSMTQGFVEQLVVSRTVPGVSTLTNAGKYYSTDGFSGRWTDVVIAPGSPAVNKGNSGTAQQIAYYTEGEGQTIYATGRFNLTASGFPSGRIAGMLVRIFNGGVSGMTSSGITWLKFDGSKTTDFAQSGIALQSSGETLIGLFSYGDGTIYGKAVA